MTLSLPLYKKLNVLFRVEPGCLGPNGIEHIEAFCKFAKKDIANLDSGYIRWVITPRYDKSLPEMEYKVRNKILTQERASKYLAMLDKSLDEFEEHLQERLAELIDQFLGR
ncbi:hypothetical protein KIH87_14700 [Paraneptunicella aestuarii]|uniref:hypothetical protein n=1 Tax=Paraneptunicella aestuarii TaxID=2831148 RepID=UPI001E4072F5|nr:hypothetical protein [Paraneptunicella aestuarii]UAA40829.1 hypothetical protein KIH87_14700 [Paraneptunicella aestuarii]